ncbi:MAG: hypothetical protein QOE61_2946, partial [Micromonosporaceae bacterium]|nr:hypothetical protein [Micromonosporaceae bacterium]
MSIKLWDWLEDLNWLVGADFPEADEDTLWRCSDAWAAAAADLRSLSPEAVLAGERVVAVLGGESGDAFADLWRLYAAQDGLVEHVAAACEQLALACDNAAIEVEYAKIQYIAALVVLAVALAALTASLVAGGVSALGMPVAIAAAQFAVRLVLIRLITAMAMGTAFNVALDAVAQGIQMLAGHRHQWDLAMTGRAAEDGAIYGAVGGGVFLAAGRFLPGLLRNPLRLVVPLAATGAIGGAAAPLAHGELPTGRDFLLALTSGIAGGLGPDLVHGRTSTPDLSRLDTLDGGHVELGSIADTLANAVAPAGLDHLRNGFASPQMGDATTLSSATSADPASGSTEVPAQRSGSYDATRPDDRGQLAGGALPESARADQGTGARPDQLAGSTGVGSVAAGSLTAAAHQSQTLGRTDAPAGVSGVTSAIVGASVPPHALASGSAPPLSTTAAAPAHSGSTGSVPGTSAPSTSPPGGAAATGPDASSAPSASAPSASAPSASATSAGGGTPATAGLLPTQTVGLQGVETSPVTVMGIQPIAAGGPIDAGTSTAASSVDNAAWQVRDAAAPNLPGWSGSENGTRLTGLQNHAADLLLARAREVEPRITEVTRDIARDVGGTLFGEENRLKTAESLKAKLSLKPVGDSLARSLAGMNDTLRYTLGLPEDRYASGARDAVGQLLDRGFRPVGEFRRWGATSGYLGYNTTWSDPASGHVFEV